MQLIHPQEITEAAFCPAKVNTAKNAGARRLVNQHIVTLLAAADTAQVAHIQASLGMRVVSHVLYMFTPYQLHCAPLTFFLPLKLSINALMNA
jgi:hypothetical protein